MLEQKCQSIWQAKDFITKNENKAVEFRLESDKSLVSKLKLCCSIAFVSDVRDIMFNIAMYSFLRWYWKSRRAKGPKTRNPCHCMTSSRYWRNATSLTLPSLATKLNGRHPFVVGKPKTLSKWPMMLTASTSQMLSSSRLWRLATWLG